MNAIVRTALASALLPVAAVFAANHPPVISNVRASQRADTKLVDVYYDAADADGDLLKVRVEISDNDGTTYSIPAFTLSGDVGEGVATGTDKHIVWDAGTDWDGEYSDKMRVKVIAIDAKGFPNMEWSNEIPPGGFLLGQDGGAEGSGPSRHVNVAWSYWMSKYEITNKQYCEFLNAAYATGIVTQQNSSVVASTALMPVSYGCGVNVTLCNIGDDRGLRWNVNNFEAVEGREDWPVCVTWYGAMAFCRFYDYDLPTEAEWEKAARGPDHDDQDEHQLYPWGDEWSDAYANGRPETEWPSQYSYFKSVGTYNGNQTPLGPDTVNGYGLYDVIGNAAEWTRTLYGSTIETYPTNESLADDRNSPYLSGSRVVKGTKAGIYERKELSPEKDSYASYPSYFAAGFRVVRREGGVADVSLRLAVKEDFETWATREAKGTTVYTSNGYNWIVGRCIAVKDDSAYSGKHSVYIDAYGNSSGNASTPTGISTPYLFLPELTEQIYEVRMRVRNKDTSSHYLNLYSGDSTDYDTSGCLKTHITIPALTDFELFSIRPVCNGKRNLLFWNGLYLDDIEIYTIVKP